VDRLSWPRAALLRNRYNLYLSGSPDDPDFIGELRELFLNTIYPQGLAQAEPAFVVYPGSPDWELVLDDLLAGKRTAWVQRAYYESPAQPSDWRSRLPGRFTLRLADQSLLDELDNGEKRELQDEFCSERASVQEFLQKSFGICPMQGGLLAGWCLSEYNCGERCEVGIATLPPYQRLGLAAAVTGAFLELAGERGMRRVGWHCSAQNLASIATARKAGFEKVCDYQALVGFIE
jgi:RimJ/RimL family protein N-acetyltransferase